MDISAMQNVKPNTILFYHIFFPRDNQKYILITKSNITLFFNTSLDITYPFLKCSNPRHDWKLILCNGNENFYYNENPYRPPIFLIVHKFDAR